MLFLLMLSLSSCQDTGSDDNDKTNRFAGTYYVLSDEAVEVILFNDGDSFLTYYIQAGSTKKTNESNYYGSPAVAAGRMLVGILVVDDKGTLLTLKKSDYNPSKWSDIYQKDGRPVYNIENALGSHYTQKGQSIPESGSLDDLLFRNVPASARNPENETYLKGDLNPGAISKGTLSVDFRPFKEDDRTKERELKLQFVPESLSGGIFKK